MSQKTIEELEEQVKNLTKIVEYFKLRTLADAVASTENWPPTDKEIDDKLAKLLNPEWKWYLSEQNPNWKTELMPYVDKHIAILSARFK